MTLIVYLVSRETKERARINWAQMKKLHGKCKFFDQSPQIQQGMLHNSNVSSVVEFQTWWILKSKIFGPKINIDTEPKFATGLKMFKLA